MDLLSTPWSELPWVVRLGAIAGAVAFVGAIGWDRVTVQREADAFLSEFSTSCRALPFPGTVRADEACACLRAGIIETYGRERNLARQSRTWSPEQLVEMAAEYGCLPSSDAVFGTD